MADDIQLIENRLAATIAPPGEVGLLLLAIYRRLRAARQVLNTAVSRIEDKELPHAPSNN